MSLGGTGCPQGWSDGSVVGLGCLEFNAETGMNWNEAKDYCRSTEVGASLVEISTPEQMDFIMLELGLLESSVGGKRWWTGGIKLENEGTWVWDQSRARVEPFVWYDDRPEDGEYLNWMYLHSIYGYLAANTYYNNPFNPICQLNIE